MSQLPIVELHAAFFYHCEECSAENFVRAVTHEGPRKILTEGADENGIPRECTVTIGGVEMNVTDLEIIYDVEEVGTCWYSTPDEVTCKECGVRFEVGDL